MKITHPEERAIKNSDQMLKIVNNSLICVTELLWMLKEIKAYERFQNRDRGTPGFSYIVSLKAFLNEVKTLVEQDISNENVNRD